MIGQILLRLDKKHGRPAAGNAAELGYLFLRRGDSATLPRRAQRRSTGSTPSVPGEPVVLFTQTAIVRSMRLAAKLGFTEVERFHAWDAEQWFGLRPPATPSG